MDWWVVKGTDRVGWVITSSSSYFFCLPPPLYEVRQVAKCRTCLTSTDTCFTPSALLPLRSLGPLPLASPNLSVLLVRSRRSPRRGGRSVGENV
ncbi:hypothetical protein E2C01_034368 [Portunus trituberculatus]|uniref:Uncharacterized protein n=1 Tax=Portunus trituberculatus TaxID=210409 RepID=A0A5B7F6G7_PORTR|nr:hypothetical protein [Portunus trituberculatus]